MDTTKFKEQLYGAVIKYAIPVCITAGIVGSVAGIIGYKQGVNAEQEKHKNDNISILMDYYGKNGLRINVHGDLGDKSFGLSDVATIMDKRDELTNILFVEPNTFEKVDSLMNISVRKEMSNGPYNDKEFDVSCSTGYGVYLTISPK